jgi:thioredoxin 1
MREKIVVFSNPGMIPESNLEEGIQQLCDLDMEKVRQDLEKAQQENS